MYRYFLLTRYQLFFLKKSPTLHNLLKKKKLIEIFICIERMLNSIWIDRSIFRASIIFQPSINH